MIKKMRIKSGIKTKWKKIMRDEIEKQKNQENDKKKTNQQTNKIT
jgi:hypothetical protein